MPEWISAADLRTLLDLPADDPSDARLELVRDIAQRQIERAIGRSLDETERTEVLDSPGTGTLVLGYRPVSDAGVTLTRYGADEAVDSDLYYVDLAAGLVHMRTPGRAFAEGYGAYTAEYTSGYATIPDDLIGVLGEVVAYHLNRMAGAGLTGETLDQYSYTTPQIEGAHLSFAARQTLANWTDVPEPL